MQAESRAGRLSSRPLGHINYLRETLNKNHMEFISPDIANVNLEDFMIEALQEAEVADQAGELPIGAVIVIDGEIISRGRARHNEFKNQLRHAELNAMLDGGDLLWKNYHRAILFTTV